LLKNTAHPARLALRPVFIVSQKAEPTPEVLKLQKTIIKTQTILKHQNNQIRHGGSNSRFEFKYWNLFEFCICNLFVICYLRFEIYLSSSEIENR